jgi:CheY-like chemotaxis protein
LSLQDSADTHSAAGGVMRTSTILVIEDNPLNLELARDVLLAAGFVVIEAQVAAEGLGAA